jgi:hypothetical protein
MERFVLVLKMGKLVQCSRKPSLAICLFQQPQKLIGASIAINRAIDPYDFENS